MYIRDQKDFYSGLLFSIVGAVFAGWSSNYSIGSSSAMGPGYFPFGLGLVLIALGSVLVLSNMALGKSSPACERRTRPWPWRPIGFVLGSNIVFGVLLVGIPAIGLPSFGLICAVYALVCMASLSSGRWSPGPILATATILAVGSYLVFVRMLGLLIPVWPWFV